MTETGWDNVLVTGDAHVASYTRTFDDLVVRLVLWDESVREVRFAGVGVLHDVGTWECDAIVRYPELDEPDGDRRGYAVIDTEANPTLTFSATDIVS